MRTMAQGQYEKGNIASVESKDKIITDLPIIKDSGSITFIDGHTPATNKSYVPTDEHPFDHFLVVCTVAKNREVNDLQTLLESLDYHSFAVVSARTIFLIDTLHGYLSY